MIVAPMAFSMYLRTATLATVGASETSRLIAENVEQELRRLQDSQSFGSGTHDVLEELNSVIETASSDNWDGYGGSKINEETTRLAFLFLESLPLGTEMPSVGSEPDGHITFEWYRSPRRLLSVSVSPNGDLHYAALLGPNKSYGTEAFFGELPSTIFDLIKRVITI